jgi:hypothetical protein
VEGSWEICMWPEESTLGYTNTDPTVGNSCKTYTISEDAGGTPTGIEEAFSLNNTYYYDGQVFLNLTNHSNEYLKVNVFSADGRIVYNDQIGGSAQVNKNIDLRSVPGGVYILQVTSEKGELKMMRFAVD